MVPQEGIEPPTRALRMRCSTPELLRRRWRLRARAKVRSRAGRLQAIIGGGQTRAARALHRVVTVASDEFERKCRSMNHLPSRSAADVSRRTALVALGGTALAIFGRTGKTQEAPLPVLVAIP